MFITFIYKIENNPKTYFGKYCTYNISDDHEGLDKEISDDLLFGINKYRKQKNLEKITNNNIPIYKSQYSNNRFFLNCHNSSIVKHLIFIFLMISLFISYLFIFDNSFSIFL